MQFATANLEVYFDRFKNNIEKVKNYAYEGRDETAMVLIPVKANAYGAGMIPVARYLENNSLADYLGVAHLVEGMELREAGIKKPILIMGQSPITKEVAKHIIQNDLEQAVSEIALIEALNKEAEKQGKKARVHLLVDTGMGRCGVLAGDAEELLYKIADFKNIELVGVMTHFSVADELDNESIDYTNIQIERFKSIKVIADKIFKQQLIFHTSNSGACMENRASVFDMIRPGIAIYGYPEHDFELELEPIMDLVTQVTLVKEYPMGHDIGYGRTYTTKDKKEYIAIIPIGYGDGLFRLLSNQLEVGINGKKYKSVGRISMDQFAVKVDETVKIGDRVKIIGAEPDDNNAKIMAKQVGTISYEIICALGNSKRIGHLYR